MNPRFQIRLLHKNVELKSFNSPVSSQSQVFFVSFLNENSIEPEIEEDKTDKITTPQQQPNLKAEEEAPEKETKSITKHLLKKSYPQKKILELLKNQLSQRKCEEG